MGAKTVVSKTEVQKELGNTKETKKSTMKRGQKILSFQNILESQWKFRCLEKSPRPRIPWHIEHNRGKFHFAKYILYFKQCLQYGGNLYS